MQSPFFWSTPSNSEAKSIIRAIIPPAQWQSIAKDSTL